MNSLLGNLGINDVEDCGELILLALKTFSDVIDTNRIAGYGWSFGGFLTARLT